jgi:type I restriction enzyme S subunit
MIPATTMKHTAADDSPQDLPEGWALATLEDVCEINPAKAHKDSLPADAAVTFLPMPAVDADEGAITAPQTKRFSEVRKGFTSFRENDVIMAKITPCMENGKAAIARNLINGLGFGSTEFHVLRPTAAVLPEFAYRFIRQESYRRSAESEMTGSVGQKRVPQSFLEATEIRLPPTPEQDRIVKSLAELLNAVKASQAKLSRVSAILKRFRQAALAAGCSGRLTEDWRENHPEVESATVTLERIRQERQNKNQNAVALVESDDLPELPDSWAWARFGFLLGELRNGISTKPELSPPGVSILRINSVRSGSVSLNAHRFLPRGAKLLPEYGLRDGDLLFTRYNGSLDLLGVCGMVRGLGNASILYPDKLMRVRFDHGHVLPAYAELFFQSAGARDRLTAQSRSSAGQQGVSGADIKSQPFALPTFLEQVEIIDRVSPLLSLADTIEHRLAKALMCSDKLTQSILAKAFRGELVPTEAELARREGREYEPASVLLDRIRAERASREKNSPSRKRTARKASAHV